MLILINKTNEVLNMQALACSPSCICTGPHPQLFPSQILSNLLLRTVHAGELYKGLLAKLIKLSPFIFNNNNNNFTSFLIELAN